MTKLKPFMKYPKMPNHHHERTINQFLAMEGVEEESFILLEKLDGANFQVYLTEDDVSYGKRNSSLGEDAQFYNWKEAVINSTGEIAAIKESIPWDVFTEVVIYCELFGPGICKRIDYGTAQQIKMYDVKTTRIIEDQEVVEWMTSDHILALLQGLEIPEFHVPVLGIFKGLSNALDFNVEGVESKLPAGNIGLCRNIEGVVIKAFSDFPRHHLLGRVIVKKKTNKFNDGASTPKKSKAIIEPKIYQLQQEFLEYINENRITDYFSKEGELDNIKDLGIYLKGIMEDAMTDFAIDQVEQMCDKNKSEKQNIFKPGNRKLVGMLKKFC